MKILFLCSNNACLSRMAKGFADAIKASGVETLSAGIDPIDILPDAVKVMKESGIDITKDKSNSLKELSHKDVDPCDYPLQ